MQFQPFEPDIEVNGQTVYAIVDGFRLFRRLASAVLQQEGIGTMKPDGDLGLERNAWYSQAAWLRAFARISEEAGTGALHAIGRQIPENAQFPDSVDTPSALQSIDIAYHLNHRKHGQIMFDPNTGKMLDGIGSYGYRRESERKVIMVCRNPYPCDFDRGIIMTMAHKFEPHVLVEHDHASCRKHGADICSYVVTW